MWTHGSPPALWPGGNKWCSHGEEQFEYPQHVNGRITVRSSSSPPSRRHAQVGGKRVPTQIPTTEVFLTTKQWSCLKWGEWVHEMWCVHTMERSSAVKSDEMLTHATPRTDFEIWWQVKEDSHKRLFMISLRWDVRNRQIHGDGKYICGRQELGVGRKGEWTEGELTGTGLVFKG